MSYSINSTTVDFVKLIIINNGRLREWFHTSTGVRQRSLLSLTIFNIFLERLMTYDLDDHAGTTSIGGRVIINLSFTDDIEGMAFNMKIYAAKTKGMTNNAEGTREDIRIEDKKLETVTQFKYFSVTVTDEG